MWKLEGALPTVAKPRSGAPIAQLQTTMQGMAPIAQLRMGLSEGVNGIFEQTVIVAVPPPIVQPDGNKSYEFDLSQQNLDVVDSVRFGGTTYVPAEDIDNPQPGEFVHDPYQQLITLTQAGNVNQPVTIGSQGGAIITGFSKTLELEDGIEYATDFVKGPFPAWMTRLPAIGQFQWKRGFEEQPSGSLTLETDRRNADKIMQMLAIGTRLPCFDMVLVIGSYQEEMLPLSEHPQGRVVLNYSLISIWDYYGGLLSRYKGYNSGLSRVRTDGDVEIDPDCNATRENARSRQGYFGNEAGGDSRTLFTSVHALAAQHSIELSTPASRVWRVEYSADTPAQAATNWLSELQARVRYVSGWIYFSDPNRVVVRNIRSGRSWRYSEASILSLSQSVQGRVRPRPLRLINVMPPAPDPNGFTGQIEQPPTLRITPEDLSLIPKAFLGHLRIDTDLSLRRNETQPTEETKLQKPKWKRQADKIVTLTTGDIDATEPPRGLARVKTMDLNHTQSGPTKETTTTTTVNGAVTRVTKKQYGMGYLGRQCVDPSTGEIFGVAAAFWHQIAEETTDTLYDQQTGYYLGTDTYGWQEKQLKTESAEPETVDLQTSADPIDAEIASLYSFVKMPIKASNRVILKSYRLFYPDADEPPAYEEYKICNPDGTSRTAYAIDPNWIEPMFVEQELTERDSFYFRTNPESTPEDPLPPYTTGEETSQRKMLRLLPANRNVSTPLLSAEVDRYVEYSFQATAGNAGFREIAYDGTFSENEGRPGTANRKQTNWTRVEAQEEQTEEEDNRNRREYRYAVTSTGYSLSDPENGNTSYPHARTVAEASIAANTDLLIKDLRESIQTSIKIPYNRDIVEGDYFTFTAHGKLYKRRVLSVSHTLVFDGEIEPGKPMVVSPGTELTLGVGVVRVSATIHRIRQSTAPKPPETKPPTPPPGIPPSSPMVLGSLNIGFLSRKTFGG